MNSLRLIYYLAFGVVAATAATAQDQCQDTEGSLCLTRFQANNGQKTSSGSIPTSTVTITSTITQYPVLTTSPVSSSVENDDLISCSSTTTITVSPVTTIYTGTYTQATTNATQASASAQLKPRRAAHDRGILHHAGQPDYLPGYAPHLVECVVMHTTTETVTVVESTTVAASDITTSTALATTLATIVSNSQSLCTTSIGSVISTTTQDIRCAPTNMIHEVNGNIIEAVQGTSYANATLAGAQDPSTCCQLCVDTPNCAALYADEGVGVCFLWFPVQTCGLAFYYNDDNNQAAASADDGYWVQAGCGTIAPNEAAPIS